MSPIRERIANRKLHREQLPIHGREVAGLLALVSLIALPVVFGLFQDSEYVRTSFAIETLRGERIALQERYRHLRIERATLESLDRVALEARRRGLVPPEEASSPPASIGPFAPAPARVPGADSIAAASPPAPSPLDAAPPEDPSSETFSGASTGASWLVTRKGRP